METRIVSPEVRDYIVETGAETLNQCMQCGLCSGLCPWRLVQGDTSDSFSIRHMQRLGQLGLDGFEDEMVLFACTTCGYCQSNCPRGVKIIENVQAMRETIVGGGVAPGYLRPTLGSAHANGNPWGGKREQRTAWMQGCDVPSFNGDQEYLLFVCCHSCYDPKSIQIAKNVARLLKAAGVSFGVIGIEENCCGESIRKLGDEELYLKLARSNIELFRKRGVKKVITTSPHCLWTFKNEYPEIGAEWEALHYTEILGDLKRAGLASTPGTAEKTVAFHDPCYLGRHCGIYDAPRQLLELVPGIRVTELARSRAHSVCCAGGGGRIWAEAAVGERFAELRVHEAVEAGAEILTSACPYCINMLADAVVSAGLQESLLVVELSGLLSEALA